MEWFGVSMNFLWIIEVLAIIFLLNIQFLIHLYSLNKLWTGPQLMGNAGAPVQFYLRLRLQAQWTAGFILNYLRGSFKRLPGRRGTGEPQPPDHQLSLQIRSAIKFNRYASRADGSAIYGQKTLPPALTAPSIGSEIHGPDLHARRGFTSI
jgi:hypothetical protein